MKKFFVLFFALGMFAFTSQAQVAFEEGHVQMKVISAEGPMAAQVNGMAVDIYKKGEVTKTQMNVMGGMVKMITIEDEDFGMQDIYVDAMGQKVKSSSMIEEEEEETPSGLTFNYDKEDTKTILDYTCHKVEAKDTAGNVITLYVTEEFVMDNSKNPLTQGLHELKGTVMEFSSKSPQGSMTAQMTVVAKESTEEEMAAPKGEFIEITPEQMKQMMGGGM